jgi:two-component system chemotaxis response regulator CheY
MSSILVIEDDDPIRRVVVTALQNIGHQVIDAPDGRAGLKIIRAQRLDLVITDVVMPEQDGLEVMMVMKREFPSTPLIAISGAVQNAPLYLSFASKLGATHVLAKPFTLHDLFATVEAALAPRVVPPAKAATPPAA